MPSAIDVAYQIIIDDNPAAAGKTFKGFTPTTADGLIREITESDGTFKPTFGDALAIEQPELEIGVRGLAGDYTTPRDEAKKIRKLLARHPSITMGDLTVLWFEPIGGIIYAGRDESRRVQFLLRFRAHMQEA